MRLDNFLQEDMFYQFGSVAKLEKATAFGAAIQKQLASLLGS